MSHLILVIFLIVITVVLLPNVNAADISPPTHSSSPSSSVSAADTPHANALTELMHLLPRVVDLSRSRKNIESNEQKLSPLSDSDSSSTASSSSDASSSSTAADASSSSTSSPTPTSNSSSTGVTTDDSSSGHEVLSLRAIFIIVVSCFILGFVLVVGYHMRKAWKSRHRYDEEGYQLQTWKGETP